MGSQAIRGYQSPARLALTSPVHGAESGGAAAGPGPARALLLPGARLLLTPVLTLPSPNPTFTAAPSASPRPALLRSSCPARFACGMAANGGHQCQCHGPEAVAEGLGTHRGERRSGAEERPRPEGLRAVKRAVCTGDTGGRPWLLPETAGADPRPTPYFGGAAALAGGRGGQGRAEPGRAEPGRAEPGRAGPCRARPGAPERSAAPLRPGAVARGAS